MGLVKRFCTGERRGGGVKDKGRGMNKTLTPFYYWEEGLGGCWSLSGRAGVCESLIRLINMCKRVKCSPKVYPQLC